MIATHRPERRRLQGNRLALFSALLLLIHLAVLTTGALSIPWWFRFLVERPSQAFPALGGIGAFELLAFVISIRTAILVGRRTRGARGRGRLATLGWLGAAHVAFSSIAGSLGVLGASQAASAGLAIAFDTKELWLSLEPWQQTLCILSIGASIATGVVLLGLLIAGWQLLSRRFRRAFWIVTDTLIAAATIYVTLSYPAQPTESHPDLTGPLIRIGVTGLLAAPRLLARLIGPFLNLVERAAFHTLVAARHLRARKTNFLAAISTLSILAVALSSCMLTTVLSVMGGFRDDLKKKILGNHAHVVVDREHGSFEGWSRTLEAARRTPGVRAATPYAHGEVMATSASNLAGAVLRGIDTQTIGSVTDLQANLTRGRLEYLDRPELLLKLPANDRRSILPRRKKSSKKPLDLDTQATDPKIDDDLDEFLMEPSAAEDVLPGIIVGQELARTLRLYLGDEIDVVSPFGRLGPAGPVPKSRSFRVAGIFYSGMYEYDMKFVYVKLETAQTFLGIGDAIHGIEAKVRDLERAPDVARAMQANIERPELRVQDWQELNRNLFGALALEKLAMFVTLGIAILIAGFCVFGTLTLMVQEKAREVGILKALGARRKSIVQVFMLEGLLIGFFGAAIGLGLGFLVAFSAQHFGIRMNPEVYYIDKLPVHMDALEFSWVGVAAIAVCLLATIVPATLASQLRPVDALRYE